MERRVLFKPEHIADTDRFDSVTFEIEGLRNWWPAGLRTTPHENRPEPLRADCGDGLVVTLGATPSVSNSTSHDTLTITATYSADNAPTYSALIRDRVHPLRALLAVCQRRPCEYFNLRVQRVTDPRTPFWIKVDPGLPEDPTALRNEVRFCSVEATDIAFNEFIPPWLDLAKANAVPAAVATSRHDGRTLESLVVEVVSAAETLHRSLSGEAHAGKSETKREDPFIAKVRAALKNSNTGLNSDERRDVISALRVTRPPLNDRLRQLAGGLGNEFCRWFFSGQLDDWALVASAIRNALSHGYQTKHAVERDSGALFGVLQTTLAIIQLRLLRAAGAPYDGDLVRLVLHNDAYQEVLHQQLANWYQLARKIENRSPTRSSGTPAGW